MFKNLSRRLIRGRTISAHLRLGQRGEKIARQLLSCLGLDILATNYSGPHGEVDIIARDGALLCFIEVKTRGRSRRSRPADAVTNDKKSNIIRTANHYIRLIGNPAIVYRYDIVEIIMVNNKPNELRYWPNEFSSTDFG